MRYFLTVIIVVCCCFTKAQNILYKKNNAHSHNDYANNIPFYRAFHQGFGSIEADIFPINGDLIVAHDKEDTIKGGTLKELYLRPLLNELKKNSNRKVSLLIDIKENHLIALPILIKQLAPLKSILTTSTIKNQLTIIISGNRPSPNNFNQYPDYIFFDHDLSSSLTPDQKNRIGMVSLPFTKFSKWNGLGVLISTDKEKLKQVIDSAHQLKKPIRFWAAPDTKTAWIAQMHLGVDIIGTDRVEELGMFIEKLPSNSYQKEKVYDLYKPTYLSDGKSGEVKNIILLIGDGMGLTQAYANYTLNGGKSNLFQIQNIGLSLTSAANAYGTDSAAGATAMATGEKTNNRYLGVDKNGKPLKSILSYATEARKKTAIIVSESITGATPAAFYAHQTERDQSVAIGNDLIEAGIDIIVGSGKTALTTPFNGSNSIDKLKLKGYSIPTNMNEFLQTNSDKIAGIMDDSVTKSVLEGRTEYLLSSFKKVTQTLKKNSKGFFLMLEGSKIDGGGHSNNLPMLITESNDFDKVIGEALRFADEEGNTLVIVTADNECGGLTLLDGDLGKGVIYSEFSTNDHTGIPVPVYAYGVHAQDFKGIYQNTEIFKKILNLLQNTKK